MNARIASRGFTLIELMIAVVIAAFLLMLGLPSFAAFLRNSEIRSTAESIVNGLRVARTEALRRNLPVSFTFIGAAGSASWAVVQVRDNSTIQSYSTQEGGTNTAVATQPAQAVTVAFNGLGRVVPNAANLQQLDIGSAYANGARSLRIYVDSAHGIRMCDPSADLALLVPRDPRAC